MISEKPSGEVLGLRFEPYRSRLACALQPLVEQLLQLIREKGGSPDNPRDLAQLRQQLENLSRLLVSSESRRQAAELSAPILEICSKILDVAPRAANHTEIVAAIALVRDAVASIDGVEQALQRSLSESAEKFASLRGLDSLQQIKAGLARHVESLRDLSAERERQWRRQMASVDRKIRTLETQLAETRLEAGHDALTGLVNRRSVEASFKLFQEARRPFVLALFDVDEFKQINDSFGHLAGDATLRAIAAKLQVSVRSQDVVGRFGGDEFIVMMVDVPLSLAERRLMSVLQSLRAIPPVAPEAPALTVTCGVSESSSADTFETVVARADQALYDAKRAGKNRLGIKTIPYIHGARR
jgi:diguanylate cyclase (GGDEF)-like protein